MNNYRDYYNYANNNYNQPNYKNTLNANIYDPYQGFIRGNMFPELYSNRNAIAKSMYKKSSDYQDTSSLLLLILIEIIAWIDDKDTYELFADFMHRISCRSKKGNYPREFFAKSNIFSLKQCPFNNK